MLKVKVQYGTDIRRWHHPQSKRYENLLNFVKETFNFIDYKQFYVQFEDDEGDHLTITSEADFEDAFSSAEQEGKKSLKIFVQKGSIVNSHDNISQPQPQVQPQVQQGKPNTKESQNDEKHEIVENDKKNEQNNKRCRGREIILDFLQNKEIQLLLPQFVRRLMTLLRKEQQSSNQKTLSAIVDEILSEEQFKPIKAHKAIVFVVPMFVEKMKYHQHVLLSLHEDVVAVWVPNLITTLIKSIETNSNSNRPCPWSSFSRMNNSNDQNPQEIIHARVACDGCNAFPIKGARYKCTVCKNYDLCSNCEASKKHDLSHPLLKIMFPDGCANQQFDGLNEFLQWSLPKTFEIPFDFRNHAHWSNNNQNHSNSFSCPFRRQENKKLSCEFITDVTILDRTSHPINTVMTKTWRVRNNGNVEWGNDTELSFFKGNECLVVEKSQPVPNAQPGEEVDVSTIIKTPSKCGLYCTYFKLKKNGSFFGHNLWVELYAVANDQISQTTEPIKNQNYKCICEQMLISISPRQAYNGDKVYCDVCNKECSSDETIYHCPLNQNSVHPDGYDMCLNCVSQSNEINNNKNPNEKKVYVDIKLDIPKPQQNNANQNVDNNINQNKNDQNKIDEDKKENKNEQVKIVPISLINSNSNQNEPKLTNTDKINKNEIDEFEFKSELNILKEIGFTEIEKMKFLLVKHKGSIERVVSEILQS